jgi:hypothetical protein
MSDRILLAEKIGQKQIVGRDPRRLHECMTESLTLIAEDMIKAVMGRYRKAPRTRSTTPRPPFKAAGGQVDYADRITGILATVAGRALRQAKREVPKAARKSRKFSFSEGLLNSGSDPIRRHVPPRGSPEGDPG